MIPVFVDTSAFVALADGRDGNHGAARRCLRRLGRDRRPLVTSTDVLDELLTLLRVRVGHAAAVAAGRSLFETRWCRLVEIGPETRAAAWELFVRFDDHVFSFTDCTSFALMRAMQIVEAFTFDRRDFSTMGFSPRP